MSAWLRPLGWPVANIIAAVSSQSPLLSPPKTKTNSNNHKTTSPPPPPPLPTCTPTASVVDHLSALIGSLRSFLLALFCLYTLHGGTDVALGYPSYGRAAVLSLSSLLSWIVPLLARNILGTLLIAGGWDYLLHISSLSPLFQKYKMMSAPVSLRQIRHDAIVASLAAVCGTVVEALWCHWQASAAAALTKNVHWRLDGWVIVTALLTVHWRNPHFYVMHRMMHPWRLPGLIKKRDPGVWLYKYVHSLHHKSWNTTALSGTNMHPVEATAYFSAAWMPFLLTWLYYRNWNEGVLAIHPVIPLTCLVDCGVGAWLGHDGFQWPGSGDYYHLLHHAHFDCNYGVNLAPFDYWFGTYAGSKEDVQKIWKED